METTKICVRRLTVVGLVGATAGVLVNATIYGLGRAADVAYVVSQTSNGPQHVRLVDVVSFSLMAFGVGLVAALIAARWGRPNLRALQVLGAVIAVASTAMDIPIDSTVAAKLSLASMHLVIGVAYITSLQAARRTQALSRTTVVERHTEALAA